MPGDLTQAFGHPNRVTFFKHLKVTTQYEDVISENNVQNVYGGSNIEIFRKLFPSPYKFVVNQRMEYLKFFD